MPSAWHRISVFTEFSPGTTAPPPGTWAGGPLLAILAGADVGSNADATSAAKGAEGWEEKAGEGQRRPPPPLSSPAPPPPSAPAQGVSACWGECLGRGDSTYEGCSVHCPWRAPSLGSSHSQTPRGRRGGPAGVCKRREHIPCTDASTEEEAPPKPVGRSVSQQAALRTRRRGHGKSSKKKDPDSPSGGSTERHQSLSDRHLPGEHSAEWPGGGPQRGLSAEGERAWMEPRMAAG